MVKLFTYYSFVIYFIISIAGCDISKICSENSPSRYLSKDEENNLLFIIANRIHKDTTSIKEILTDTFGIDGWHLRCLKKNNHIFYFLISQNVNFLGGDYGGYYGGKIVVTSNDTIFYNLFSREISDNSTLDEVTDLFNKIASGKNVDRYYFGPN